MAVWPIIYVFGTALSIVVADTTADQEKSPEKLCVMPPYPAHGTYLSYVGASPGDKGVAAHFGVFCDKGYVLVGEKELTCLSGMWSDDMPECVPVCKAGKKSGVVQCTAESAQCVITPELLPTLGHRTASGKYSCGSVSITDHVIAGGTNAHFFDSPWHAGLYTKTTKPYMQICGGTLIARDVVVTAAHCFSRDGSTPPAYKYAVAVGKIYRPWNEEHDKKAQKADVKEIRIPPRYFGSTGNFQDDIALVIVDKEFDYTDAVTPACLSFDRQLDEDQLQDGNLGKASVNLIDHTKCKLLLHAGSMRRWYFPGRAGPFVLKPKLVFGWGLTGENGRSAQILQVAELPYVNIRKCVDQSPTAFKSSITGDKFCAGYNNGTAVCRGDSGGGLMFPKNVGGKLRFFLRGVVSTSPSSENACNIFTWATFTHVMKHEAFLTSVVGTDEVASVVAAPVTNQPATYFGEYPVYNLDFRMQTKKPQSGWI